MSRQRLHGELLLPSPPGRGRGGRDRRLRRRFKTVMPMIEMIAVAAAALMRGGRDRRRFRPVAVSGRPRWRSRLCRRHLSGNDGGGEGNRRGLFTHRPQAVLKSAAFFINQNMLNNRHATRNHGYSQRRSIIFACVARGVASRKKRSDAWCRCPRVAAL